MPHELTPEQDRALMIAYHDAECSCRDDVSTYPKVPGPLRSVVAQLLADERERIAHEIEADVDRMRRAGGGIFTADFIEGTRYAASIARGPA